MFQGDRPSWKFADNIDDPLGKKISRYAIYSARKPRNVRFSLFNSGKHIPNRKHSIREMVIRPNNVFPQSVLCEVLLLEHSSSSDSRVL